MNEPRHVRGFFVRGFFITTAMAEAIQCEPS
jgi:hypothetical protein